ncbi:MAG: hypothetical protein H0U18_12685 [Pyrinomonadaceae bacterium]|nr:hypothetical protein [Pyrinomonadaceae bacterium]
MSILSNSNSTTPPSTLVEDGLAVYEKLRATLESEHSGAFVAIEPSSGRYFLGETATAALVAARDAMPESLFFLTRVGRTSAHKIRRSWLTNQVIISPTDTDPTILQCGISLC